MMKQVAYIDVDDTLVRSVGTKRIPIPQSIAYVRSLKEQGFELYCWSAGGAEYARESAKELGIETSFSGFLPKPTLLFDDQTPSEWPSFQWVHPSAVRNPVS